MMIGEIIKFYRKKANLTQAELGEVVGVMSAPQKRVAEWECGKRKPSADYLLKIIGVLKIPLEEFQEYRDMLNKNA